MSVVSSCAGFIDHMGTSIGAPTNLYLCDCSMSGWTEFYTVMLGGLDPPVMN